MEIKTQDFRIGNYLHYPNWNNDGKNAVFKVRDLYFEDGKIALTNGIIQIPHTNLKYLKPIPLTEEVLLRCGFKLDYESTYTKVYELEISGLYFIYKHSIQVGLHRLVWGSKVIECKYLHILQNLIFALTGEELQYNHSQDI